MDYLKSSITIHSMLLTINFGCQIKPVKLEIDLAANENITILFWKVKSLN